MLKVYGASDDLIEGEGDITFEISCIEPNGRMLAFSDGTLLEVKCDGCWRFDVRAIGTSNPQKTFTAESSDDDNYSDIIEFSGPIKWAVFGERGE